MADAFVAERAKGGGNTGSGTTLVINVTGVTVGNHLILVVPISPPTTGTMGLSSVTDDKGNTYQLDVLKSGVHAGNARGIAVASCKVGSVGAGGALTITLHFGNAGTAAYKVEEYSGLDPTSWFDVGAAGETAASTSVATNSITPAAAGELIVAGFGPSVAESSFTPGSGFTQAGTPRNAAQDVCVEYDLSGPSGSQNATGTLAAAGVGTYSHVIAAYKVAVTTQDLDVGHVSSPQAVRGVTLSPQPVSQQLRKLLTSAHVRFLTLIIQQKLGKVASPAAVHGVTLSPQPVSKTLKKITSPSAVRGVTLSGSGSVNLSPGHIPSGAAVRGVRLVSATNALFPGKIATAAIARGVTFITRGVLTPGKITSRAALRGVKTEPLVAPQTLKAVSSPAVVRGVMLTPAAVSLLPGLVPSARAVRGVKLVNTTQVLKPGKVAHTPTLHGVILATVGITSFRVGKVASRAVVRPVCVERSLVASQTSDTVIFPNEEAALSMTLAAAGDDPLVLTPDTQEFC